MCFAYSEFINNNSLTNASAVSAAQRLVSRLRACSELPRPIRSRTSTGGWNSGLTEINEFDFNSGIYGPEHLRQDLEGSVDRRHVHEDHSTHSVKAGFYWDAQENLQANGSDINGNYDFENWGYTTT